MAYIVGEDSKAVRSVPYNGNPVGFYSDTQIDNYAKRVDRELGDLREKLSDLSSQIEDLKSRIDRPGRGPRD